MGPSYGGPFESVRHGAKALHHAGIDIEVAMPYGDEAAAHLLEWAPVRAVSSGRVLFAPFEWSPDFAKAVLSSDADILHTQCIWQHPSWVAMKWKRQGRPHVASIKGMLEPWAWQYKAWKKRPVWWLWEKRNLQSASLLHATSEAEYESLRTLGLRTPIAMIPHGVGLPEISSLEPRIYNTRTALFLSRIHPKKGLPILLEAWASVKPVGWHLRIIGPDERGHRAELEQQVEILGLGEAVSFSGPLQGDGKTDAFLDSELFILPTHSENFGIVIAEALAHRLPVITTHGAPWQLLETGRCGWWVPVSVDGIAAALEDATRRSPEELAAMGERGRAVVAERFAWERIAGEFLGCYRWLLGEGEVPGCVMD